MFKKNINFLRQYLDQNKERAVLFLYAYEAIDSDYNFKLIKFLNKYKFKVVYVNYFENTTNKYKYELNTSGNIVINIKKFKFKLAFLRHFINAVTYIIFLSIIICKYYNRFSYIFIVDYQLNIIFYILEKILFKRGRKNIYVLQEMYQYQIKNILLRYLVIELDKKVQKESLCILNRNEIRKAYVDKINKSIKKKHIITVDGIEKYLDKRKNTNIKNKLDIIYAGSMRARLPEFIAALSKALNINGIEATIHVYGMREMDIKSWQNIIESEERDLKGKILLNGKRNQEEIDQILEHIHFGIVYYPKGSCASLNERLAAPSKMFTYIRNMVPIISYGSIAAERIIQTYKIGININDIDDMELIIPKIISEYAVYLDNLIKLKEKSLFTIDQEFRGLLPFLKI